MASTETRQETTPTPPDSLTINQVLDLTYEGVVRGLSDRRILQQFEGKLVEWDSINDFGSKRSSVFELLGVLVEIGENSGVLVVKSDERNPTWFPELIKVVSWNKYAVGGNHRYPIRVGDYPTWDDVPLNRLIHELPRKASQRSFSSGGLLMNLGQRLVLNGVIPMQPEFVYQRESVSSRLVRGPGGVFIVVPEDMREEDRMYGDDIVTSGALYRPSIVPYLVEEIVKDLDLKSI